MKNFIFAFILFAHLLTINVAPFKLNKRTTFYPCSVQSVDLFIVSIVPDPPESGKGETFYVSVTLTKHEIIKNKTFLGISYAGLDGTSLGDPYYSTFTESYKAGDLFSVTLSDVPTPQLPDAYYIGVTVGDPTNDPKNPLDIYGCVYAEVIRG
ncbi:hypothetical protein C2G38_2083318 [Gigaspora rosea]|uniref:MD-2-related lipid-recognition domain-containing protein n=1 Tax=Gigaspora rosea TaxID=44941 RepID=A0A397VJK4_9GLOM|nr:hypothetical protein C2G38_2083318 [Gigaspora rosea]